MGTTTKVERVQGQSYAVGEDESALLDGTSSASLVKSNKLNLSIQILYPLLFTLLLVLSLGVTIVLGTLSHLRTVESLVEDVHTEVSSKMLGDITNYFDIGAVQVGDTRDLISVGLLDPNLPTLRNGSIIPDATAGGNGNFPKWATLYLQRHPQITTVTIAVEQSRHVMWVEESEDNTFLLHVRNATSEPDLWSLRLDAAGDYINPSEVVDVLPDYRGLETIWYTVPRDDPRGRTEAVWSPPFLWLDKSHMGVFCGGRISDASGAAIGVVGSDIVVTAVQRFFSEIGLKGGTAFIMEPGGGVFTSSLDVQFASEDADGNVFFHDIFSKLNETEHGPLVRVSRKVDERMGGFAWSNATLKSTIDDHAVFISPINDKARSGLHLMVVLPLKPFREDVEDDVITSAFIAAALLVSSACAAILFSIGMTRPLARATATLNKCAALDIAEVRVETRSWIKEIASLQESTASLLAALRSFALYVPHGVVRTLLINKKAAVAEMEERELSIFFCDIANFTELSHTLSPNDTSKLLATYFSIITRRLEESGATTDKFLGDGVLAFWGAPEPIKRRQLLAMSTILHIESDIRKHQERHAKERDALPTPNVRIGIHDGSCLVGNVGTRTRLNYTVIGDAVNLTSRLESLCKFFNTTHLLTEDIARGSDKDFVVRKVAIVAVKGRTQATSIVDILARTSDSKQKLIRVSSLKRAHESALALLTDGKFHEAADAFQICSEKNPDDGPSSALASICSDLAANPPKSWGGFIEMQEK